jgi:hypothetical protein
MKFLFVQKEVTYLIPKPFTGLARPNRNAMIDFFFFSFLFGGKTDIFCVQLQRLILQIG